MREHLLLNFEQRLVHYQLSQEINVRDASRNSTRSYKITSLQKYSAAPKGRLRKPNLIILNILKYGFIVNEIIYCGFRIFRLECLLHCQRCSACQKYLIVENTGI